VSDRFYFPAFDDLDEVELAGSEAHHLLHVMRAAVGDRVVLFDGQGATATAEVIAKAKKSATLRLLECATEVTDRTTAFTLATAVPKGDRFRWLVEKATELGVDRLIPLDTARGVVHPRDTKLDKLQQTVIAACKQSGRNRLMAIEEAAPWDAFVSRELHNRVALVAHPTGKPLHQILSESTQPRSVVAAIGPEGGFTDAEVEAAVASGAQLVSLGKTILRTETAAIATAAMVMQQIK
jgi:16S rRNA (uracil1498-N3)-methyltransferase